jgi:outer membrane protein TolC
MERQEESQIGCRRFPAFGAVCGLLLLSGCMVGSDYQRPNSGIDLSYSIDHVPELQGQTPDLGQWWVHFRDPVLHQLICEASTANLTVREAAQRIMESRARRDIAVGNFSRSHRQRTVRSASRKSVQTTQISLRFRASLTTMFGQRTGGWG